jgi:ABC-type sugar transport system permease subunit
MEKGDEPASPLFPLKPWRETEDMKRLKKSALMNDSKTALFFVLPSLAGFIVFLIVPIFSSFLISFTNYSGSFRQLKLIGLHNYRMILLDEKFWQSVSVTFIFVAASVVLQLVLGFFFAVLLNQRFRGRTLFRSVIFLPVVLSSIAVCLSFLLLFHPTQGPINNLLKSLSLPPVPWLSDKSTALLSIVIVFVWQSFGYYMIIFLSGLQSINETLYEAADMDGASGMDKLLHVTIPVLTPVLFFSLIIAIINAFKAFDHIYIMTGGQYGGGPAGATSVLSFDIYKNGFLFWQIGYGAAESVVLFAVVLAVTVIQYRMQMKWVHYEVV